MKRGLLKKIFATLIAILLVIGFVPNNGLKKVEAAEKTIYASEMKKDGPNITYTGDLVLVMDEELYVNCLEVKGNLKIKGKKRLFAGKYIAASGSFTMESGTDVEINYLCLSTNGDIVIENGANLKIYLDSNGSIYGVDSAIYSQGADITISGNVTITSAYSGITASSTEEGGTPGTITINGGCTNVSCSTYGLQGNVKISGGEVDVKGDFAIDAVDLNISGGKVKAYGPKFAAIYSEKTTTISGGEIAAESGYNEAILGMKGLTISSPSKIVTPEDGYVDVATNYYGDGFTVFDSNKEVAQNVVIKEGKKVDPEDPNGGEENNNSNNNSNNNNNNINNNNNSNNNNNNTNKNDQPKYSNEWINGKWYDADGKQTYEATLSWKSNSTGWWVEDDRGWYPVSSWQRIDGIWYYFGASGYMASNEYVDGYWLNSDGSCSNDYYLTWKSNSTGWWVEDKSGWWPSSQWLKIDGSWYYFDASGYMVTSQYVDGYWIGANGVCN